MKIFKDDRVQSAFETEGYVLHGSIDSAGIHRLIELDDSLKIPDFVGCDFNVGMNSDIFQARKTMQDKLTEILMPYFEDILDGFDYFSASYVNKNPTKRFVITAHQDFTYCEEPQEKSFMCWIPLLDTNMENGAIGFVPKSHLFYNYKRAFPFPLNYSPVVKNELELMKYLDILDMKAGQMVFFYNNTIHGSFANYTNQIRQAINISFIKKGSEACIYITKPDSEEKTLLKFKADKNFLLQYNNPGIQKMYMDKDVKIDNYPFLGEEAFGNFDSSWKAIDEKLKKYDVKIQDRNVPYLHRYLKIIRREKIKDRLYSTLKRFIPLGN